MFTIFPGTTIIFFGVLPSIHLAEFSWARAAFSISSRGISAGSFHAETSFAVEGDSVSKRVFFQVFFVVDRPFGIAYGSIVTAGMP